MRINPDCLIIVADGQNANFFQNQNAGARLKLGSVHTMTLVNEASHDLGAGRPGHAHVAARKTSYEQPDLHQVNEKRFLQQVASKAQELFRAGAYKKLALIAEPRALGILRQQIDPRLKGASSVQIAKDYTNTAMPDLERILADHPG